MCLKPCCKNVTSGYPASGVCAVSVSRMNARRPASLQAAAGEGAQDSLSLLSIWCSCTKSTCLGAGGCRWKAQAH